MQEATALIPPPGSWSSSLVMNSMNPSINVRFAAGNGMRLNAICSPWCSIMDTALLAMGRALEEIHLRFLPPLDFFFIAAVDLLDS